MSANSPEIHRLVLGPLQTNCYLVICPYTHSVLVIDPADQAGRILRAAEERGASIKQILLTHAHPDHLGGLPDLREATGAKVLAHRLDVQMLDRYCRLFGIRPELVPMMIPDVQLEGDEQISIGQFVASVVHTPGHSPGSITLKLGKALFTGDTLFAQGVGRVDLPGGDLEALMQSIQQLFALPDDCTVYPGHGPASTIGTEKRDNPYV